MRPRTPTHSTNPLVERFARRTRFSACASGSRSAYRCSASVLAITMSASSTEPSANSTPVTAPSAAATIRATSTPGADLDTGLERDTLERGPQRIETAHRIPAAEARLDVGNAGKRRRGSVRRRPRVRGVSAGPLHETRVVEERLGRAVQGPHRVDRGEVERRAHPLGQRPRVRHRPGEERPVGDVPDRRPRASNARHCSPDPGANSSNAVAVASSPSGTSSDEPSAQW